jgi:hypothetical protein
MMKKTPTSDVQAHAIPPIPTSAPSPNGTTGLFYYPEEVTAAYEGAEYKIRQLLANGRLSLPTWADDAIRREPLIRCLSREIADAVIRTVPDWTVPVGDIADIPEVNVEKVSRDGN